MNTATIINNNEDLSCILKSCAIAASAMNSAFTITRSILMKRLNFDCEDISHKINLMLKASMIAKAARLKLAGNIDLCSALEIKGAANYKLQFAKSDHNKSLPCDVMYISLGINYQNHCSNYARTLLINPTDEIKQNYNWMLLIQENILNNLQDGVELYKVYDSVITFVKNECHHLLKHLDKELAFALGLDFKKTSIALRSDSNFIAKENMIFSVNIKLSGLKDPKMIYTLVTSDTVIVRKGKEARPLTLYNNKLQHLIIEEKSCNKVENAITCKKLKIV